MSKETKKDDFRCRSCGEMYSKGEECSDFGKNKCIYCAQAAEECGEQHELL